MEIINVIYYILIFCIGCLVGSFSTLAVYRLPIHEDITHKRSFCPNCNHKLAFLDLIPVLSYIFLGGRCRYCKEKIRIRYLILEVLSGLTFVLIAASIKSNFIDIKIDKLVYTIFIFFYITGIIIISGIDKEKKQICKAVLVYEILLLNIYMIYLYIVENANIYRYVIYLFVMLILVIIDNFILKKKLKNSYTINILILSIIMCGFTYGFCFLCTVIVTFIAVALNIVLKKCFAKKENNKLINKDLPIGFYLCISNIICLIITNYMAYGWL